MYLRMSNVEQQLCSGALSGLTSSLCLQPLDVLKTRLQQGNGSLNARDANTATRTVRNIMALDGIRGLWRGTAATLIRNVPGVALYMTTLTQLRTVMSSLPYFVRLRAQANTGTSHKSSVLPVLTSQGNLIAGATARVGVGFLLNPFSVLKARFESNLYRYDSLVTALTSIARLGPSELTRGFMASSLRDAPYAGLFLVIYEGLKREASFLIPRTTHAEATAIHGLSAAAAGTVATLITHPFDVIKTKIQVRSEDEYRGMRRTIKTIWERRGFSGFFDGAALRLCRKVTSSAIGWAVYEGVLMLIWSSNTNQQSR